MRETTRRSDSPRSYPLHLTNRPAATSRRIRDASPDLSSQRNTMLEPRNIQVAQRNEFGNFKIKDR